MDKGKIKIIMPEQQNKEVFEICRKLWRNNFDDSEEYISFYFSDRWKQSITFLYDKKSMLHLNPYEMYLFGRLQTIYYIVGVCTRKEDRHRGYMNGLLKKSLKYLYDRNAPFVYLMPSNENIYLPYDFTGIYKTESFVCEQKLKERQAECDDIEVVKYDSLTEKQKQKLIEYSNKKLLAECDCFVQREKKYFEQKNIEMKACGSSILVFINRGNIVGYAMHICEDIPELVEFTVDEKYREKCIEKMFEYSYCNNRTGNDIKEYKEEAKIKMRFNESKFTEKEYIGNIWDNETKNLLMARIVDIKKFVALLKTDVEEQFHIEIEDTIIKENNGKWDIYLGQKSKIKSVDYVSADNKNVYLKMSIGDFADMMFSKIKFYLNEMV